MSDQSELDFAVTHSRLRGEPTSFRSAQEIAEYAAEQCRQLHAALVKWGPMNADEADAKLEGGAWQRTTAGRRMIDLVRQGRAEFAGIKRKTRSGRYANVYRAVQTQSEAA